jgi:3-oxoacyl-[acyl-carrier protein] reductase
MNCALITGGSKGIGKAIAIQLAKDHNLHILVNYSTDNGSAEETRDNICREGGSCELLKFDVQDKSKVDEAILGWQEKNPEKFVSVLVNNAGVPKDGLFMWMPEADWDKVIGISLKGMYNVTQAVIKPMLHKRKGRIINIVSLSGLKGIPGQTNYSAAKAGMIGATKALAQEVAKRNVTVNAIAPGFVNTGMTANMDIEKYHQLIPMGRSGEPEEIAHLVSFIASDKASYITGEVININGGIYS